MSRTPLTTYLNDHLAGSVVAIRLLESLESSLGEYEGTRDMASIVMQVRREIEEERGVLEALIAQVGSGQSALRKTAGWFAERFAEAKMAVDDDRSGAFRQLEQAEVVTLGIWGKRGLWRALMETSLTLPGSQALDFAALVERSKSQFERMERVRMAAARTAFSAPRS